MDDTCGRRFSIIDNCRVATVSSASLSGHGTDSMTVTQRHFNHTSHVINIKSRIGMNVQLQPSRNGIVDERIEIQLDWQMSADAFRRAQRDLNNKNLNPDPLMQMVLRAIDVRYPSQSRHSQVSAVVIIKVSWKDLVKAGGVVYLEELDLLISVGDPANDLVDHPFSANERLRAGLAASIPHLGKETFIMSVKAVDNNPLKKHRDRFLLVGDEVHHIPIEEDPSLETGVHITMRRSADLKNETGDGGRVHTQFMTFEEADRRFGFADSIETARAGGNWEMVYKETIAKLGWERKLREEELRDKAFEREEKVNDSKHRHYQERAREELKKEEVKNFGDWMRIIGVAITAVCALTGIFAKMKPT